jgi:outer membrane lipopolysaccharide assembly protein LptE/RlpB
MSDNNFMNHRLTPLTAAACVWMLLLSGCGRDMRTAQGVVEEFVDQHYVKIDLQKSKQYAVGLALEKINEEIRLTTGQVIDASTRKPSIHYRLLEKKEADIRASFLYEGTIQAEDAPMFIRRWLVTARKDQAGWRVSNFTEYPD